MGAAWSYLASDDAFHKDAHLARDAEPGFYPLFRQSVSLMEDELGTALIQDGLSEATLEEGYLVLQHWTREVDVLYDSRGEFPLTLRVRKELELRDYDQEDDDTTVEPLVRPMPSREEAVLQGLCASPLSTCESVYQATLNLKQSVSGGEQFLKALAKYPRAFRLYATQQKLAACDVTSAFRAAMLTKDYAAAGSIIGKLAYSDDSFPVRLKRLEEMASAYRRSLDQSAMTLSTAMTSTSDDVEATCAARAATSFAHAMAEDTVSLLETQRKLETVLHVGFFVGSSLIETVQKLVALYPSHPGVLVLAAECAEQYQVCPRQFWWVLLRVLAQNEQWRVLLHLASFRRPAIGFVPLVELLLDAGRDDLAQELLACVEAPDERQQVIALLASGSR